jgi:hypothetical protein
MEDDSECNITLHYDICLHRKRYFHELISYTYDKHEKLKVNILGGHSISHYKQKIVYVHVSYSKRFMR